MIRIKEYIDERVGDRREKGKLQIAPLKFSGDWILHPEISEFGFYPLKFGVF